MEFDFLNQIIIHELHRLYSTALYEQLDSDYTPTIKPVNTFSQYGISGLYDNLYDFLIKDGHKIEFDKETKKKLYQLAIKSFNEERKSWIQSGIMSEEGMKTECNKFYKSYLVRKYLLDHYTNTGEKLNITDEKGNKILRISFGNIR